GMLSMVGPRGSGGDPQDRLLWGFPLELAREPLELLLAEIAEPAGLEVHDVDETDEMHPVRVKAVPAGALGVSAVAIVIELHPLVEEIMLAWHVVHVESGLRDDASGVVELGWLGAVRDVPGVNHEGRFCRQRFDLGDGLFERTDHIGIGRLVEPDMAVTDLQEGELARL